MKDYSGVTDREYLLDELKRLEDGKYTIANLGIKVPDILIEKIREIELRLGR